MNNLKDKIIKIDGGLFKKKKILAVLEGEYIGNNNKEEESIIYFPNFHAILYYIKNPPQIVGKILDFGITSRILFDKELKFQDKEEIKKCVDKSFKEMVKQFLNYLYYLLIENKLNEKELYKFEIPFLFKNKLKYNPWKDFIEISKKGKIEKIKKGIKYIYYDNKKFFIDVYSCLYRPKNIVYLFDNIK